MNRRHFIRQMLLGTLGPIGFLSAHSLVNYAQSSEPTHRRRLILVELAGANDGLNTLVPYRDDNYYKARPTIGLSASDVIHLSDEQSVHAELEPLLSAWEDGDMAWVQGLGYPNANRSHFTSIALWESAGDGLSQRNRGGWITHAMEHQLPRTLLDPHGISMAGNMGIFASDSGRWLSLRSLEQLKDQALPDTQATTDFSRSALSLVQSRLNTLDATMSTLASKVDSGPRVKRFAAGAFGEQLRQVARLITSGVETPVYRVRLDGFDTHQNQLGRHARLLRNLSSGLEDLIATLKAAGEWDNTLIFTYSEFGRRAVENSSRGTDHGTAAPHMLLGGAVNGGLYSDEPSLSQLVDDDLKFTMDYRALYRQILVSGLGIDEQYPYLSEYGDDRLSGLLKPA
ncbi:MAG: DUF1501 domain-containing protein [Granulosicoccus sp.]